MATTVAVTQLIQPTCSTRRTLLFPVPSTWCTYQKTCYYSGNHGIRLSDTFSRISHHNLAVVAKASSKNESIVEAEEEDGVQLGTMKLPSNTDIPRFESLLFQWANSLCQGATLPLPMPLKVDKITGGARVAFIIIGDAKTEVLVYIDCLVFPATENSGPVFRAIRNGPSKEQSPPGEPRIMRSLQEALKKSVQIAQL